MAWVTIDLNTNRVIYVAGGANPFGVPPGKLEINTGSGGGGEIGWVYNPENQSVKPPPSFLMPVRCATTAAVTFLDLQIGDVIDGVTLAAGDRVLLKDQSPATGNLIYLIYPSGNIPALDVATDASSPQEMLGATVRVLEGTVNGGSLWTCTTSPIPGPGIGVDNITWARIDATGLRPAGANGTQLTADSSTGTGLSYVAPLDVQTFASSGTWTKPTSPRYTRAAIFICGAGGGGGSGRRGATSTHRNGGAGGGGGAIAVVDIALSTLGSTETVTIGTGGAGGAAVTANDTSGNAGANGSAASTFGTAWLRADKGAGGPAGDASASTSGATFPGLGSQSGGPGAGMTGGGQSGTAGGGTNTGIVLVLIAAVISSVAGAAAGGGSGGGVRGDTNAGGGGGTGGNNQGWSSAGVAGGTGGGAGSGQTAGTAGTAAPVGSTFGGLGGGGGAAGNSGAGTAGGVGGAPGGGGGGGGGSLNGVNSGAGGAGANGYCAVVCY